MRKTNKRALRLGLLVPFTNSNLEPDFAAMTPPGIAIHTTRMGGYDKDEIPDAKQMQGLGESDLAEPLRLLSGVAPDVIVYGCTSATLSHGPAFDRKLSTTIEKLGGAATVTAAGALIFALKSLGVARIGFASPYEANINALARRYLSDMGFETVSNAEVDRLLSNDEQGALTPEDVCDLARRANSDDADAIVLSCTDMRSVEVVDALERELDKPVVTSNQAMLFQVLSLLKTAGPVTGYGQILRSVRE